MKPLTPAPGMRNADPRWPDAQPFMPDAEYVKKGAEIDDTDVTLQRTILGNGDVFYAANTSLGNVTVTLPTVGDELGRTHIIKRTTDGTNSCTIVAAEGTAILDRSATHSIAVQDGVRAYFSDGSRWRSTTVMGGANAEVANGTYTPTLTSGANVSATYGATAHYLRNGDDVVVAGNAAVSPTAAGGATTVVEISLPVASTFADVGDCVGMAHRGAVGTLIGVIAGGVGATTATLAFPASATSTLSWRFNFQYRVRR